MDISGRSFEEISAGFARLTFALCAGAGERQTGGWTLPEMAPQTDGWTCP